MAQVERSLIVIPARLQSARLPRKVLLRWRNRTLLEYTYRQALKCWEWADVVVATDSRAVLEEVLDFNGHCVFDDSVECSCGSHRAARCLETLSAHRPKGYYSSLIVWQADEPCVNPDDVKRLLTPFSSRMTTLIAALENESQQNDPNQVKALIDPNTKRAHWFSRVMQPSAVAHVGVYHCPANHQESRCNFLAANYDHDCVKAQSLEQLAWICGGFSVFGIETTDNVNPLSINIMEDWEKFCKLIG